MPPTPWTPQPGTNDSPPEQFGGVARILLDGDIDLFSVDRWTAEFMMIVAAQPSLVVVDTRDVTFLDATGLRLIARLLDELPATVVLVPDAPRAVARPLEASQLDQHRRLVLTRSALGVGEDPRMGEWPVTTPDSLPPLSADL